MISYLVTLYVTCLTKLTQMTTRIAFKICLIVIQISFYPLISTFPSIHALLYHYLSSNAFLTTKDEKVHHKNKKSTTVDSDIADDNDKKESSSWMLLIQSAFSITSLTFVPDSTSRSHYSSSHAATTNSSPNNKRSPANGHAR